MEKKEYKEFRELLRTAMGELSQQEFADKAKISRGHLNRLLNNELISRPSAETLCQIAKASSGIDESAFFYSCGYSAADYRKADRFSRSSLSTEDRIKRFADDLRKKVEAEGTTRAGIVDGAALLDFLGRDLPERPTKGAVLEGFPKPLPNDPSAYPALTKLRGESCIAGYLDWEIHGEDYTEYTLVKSYFAIGCVISASGKIIICDIDCGLKALEECGAVSSAAADQLYEAGIKNPYSLQAYAETKTEKRTFSTRPERVEEKLLKAIFGDEEDCVPLTFSEFGHGFIADSMTKESILRILKLRDAYKVPDSRRERINEFMDELEDIDLSKDGWQKEAKKLFKYYKLGYWTMVTELMTIELCSPSLKIKAELEKRVAMQQKMFGKSPVAGDMLNPRIIYCDNKDAGDPRVRPVIFFDTEECNVYGYDIGNRVIKALDELGKRYGFGPVRHITRVHKMNIDKTSLGYDEDEEMPVQQT